MSKASQLSTNPNESSTSLIQVNYLEDQKYKDIDTIDIEKNQIKDKNKQKINSLFAQNYQPANFQKAMEFYNSKSYKRKTASGEYLYLETFQDTQALKTFGLGTYFYIEWMRRITWVFFFLSILELVRIYINIMSNGMQDTTPGFASYLITSTLGNYKDNVISQYDNYIMALIPAVIYLILFIFNASWKKHYQNQIAADEQNNYVVKPQKFCLQVQGFDQDNVQQKDLQNAFVFFGPVYEVSLIRRFENKLEHFEKLQELEHQINQMNKQELQKIKQQKQQLNSYIKTLSIKPKVISAFIHFQYQKSKIDCLTYFNDRYLFNSSMHSCMNSVCCCCIDDVRPQFTQNGKIIKIRNSKVSNPQDINWNSYQIGELNRCLRVFVAFMVIIFFLIISCAAIGICSIYIQTNITDCEPIADLNCPQVTCRALQKSCYCNKNVFLAISNSVIHDYCGSQIAQIYLVQGIQYVVIIISTIINIIFALVVQKIVNFTRPKTNSIALAIKTIILTAFTIINTIFIPLLIYSNIYGFKATSYVSFLTIISSDLKNTFQVDTLQFYFDFSRIWYTNVSPIYTNFLVFDIVFIWIFFIYGKICRPDPQKIKSQQGKMLQKSMNQQITQFQYSIVDQFSGFNLVLFTGVFFSAGIPIIVPITFLNLGSRYITSRVIIQTQSSKIDGLGQDFMLYPLTFMPILIVLSSLFGCWMLTANENLMPPKLNFFNPAIFLSIFQQYQQLSRQLSIPFYLIIALITIIRFFFQQTIQRFFSCLASLCFEKKVVVHPQNTQSFTQHAKTMNVSTSYNIRNNNQMRNVILNLQKYLTTTGKS